VKRKIGRFLSAVLLTLGASASAVFAVTGPAHADGCYTWSETLQDGSSGDAVKQLQIRLAGYPNPGDALTLDGSYGPLTAAAVSRFEAAYGLPQNGIADSVVFNKIYELQDDDCTPIHFSYEELNDCNTTWAGGKVSATQAKANALVTMWKLEAMRHALNDNPIRVTSGFRSTSCNASAGGASDSRHLYGDAADLGKTPNSLCTMAQEARKHGFMGILGPGYPDHDDHVHTDMRANKYWSAPDCGVSSLSKADQRDPLGDDV
jgi:zinc D-Ala-D-Ala carboxypeptidase